MPLDTGGYDAPSIEDCHSAGSVVQRSRRGWRQ
jgi:hypothetical protein